MTTTNIGITKLPEVQLDKRLVRTSIFYGLVLTAVLMLSCLLATTVLQVGEPLSHTMTEPLYIK